MNNSLDEIVKHIEKEVRPFHEYPAGNTSSQDLYRRKGYSIQILFGVENPHKFTRTIDFYKDRVNEELKPEFHLVNHLAFIFDNRIVLNQRLQELSNKYSANLNIPVLTRHISFNDEENAFIIISIIKVPMIY